MRKFVVALVSAGDSEIEMSIVEAQSDLEAGLTAVVLNGCCDDMSKAERPDDLDALSAFLSAQDVAFGIIAVE